MKYKITEESIEYYGNKLFRIEALIDLKKTGVKAGEKGGYIEKESNLGNAGRTIQISQNMAKYAIHTLPLQYPAARLLL